MNDTNYGTAGLALIRDDLGRLAAEVRGPGDHIFSDGFESGDTSAWEEGGSDAAATLVYTFNSADQLTRVESDGQALVDSAYDGDGLRASKTVDGQTVYYLRDPSGNTLVEFDQDGTLLAEYISANGRLIAKVAPDGEGGEITSFFHADHLGSALVITDDTGTVTWTGDYYSFGEEYSSIGTPDRYRFTQHELDPSTALIYAKARYYNPRIGRFISVDPVGGEVGSPQRWNRYAYVLNNPTRYVDPDGRVALVYDLAVAGLVLTTGAVIAWWNSPAIGDSTKSNGQIITQDAVRLAGYVGQSFRKIRSPDRYKAKDKAGRDREREKQDRWEKKEPKPEPASDNDAPSPEDLISPGPLRIPRGAGTILEHARTAGDFPGGGGDPLIGAASMLFMTVTAHEIETTNSDSAP